MAVEGLPDPKRHAICRKCLQWFPLQDGERIWPPVTGLMSFVRVRAAKLADAERLKQFWCHACQQRRTEKTAKSVGSFLVGIVILVLAGGALWWTGIVDELLAAFTRR